MKTANTGAKIQDQITGLYMTDATSDFQTLAVSPVPSRAFSFIDAEAAEHARKFISALYPRFNWQVVPA